MDKSRTAARPCGGSLFPPPSALPPLYTRKGLKHEAHNQTIQNCALMHTHARNPHRPPPAQHHLTPHPPHPFHSLHPHTHRSNFLPLTAPGDTPLSPSFTPPHTHIAAAIRSATPAPPPSPSASRPSRRCGSSSSGTPHGPRGGLAGVEGGGWQGGVGKTPKATRRFGGVARRARGGREGLEGVGGIGCWKGKRMRR